MTIASITLAASLFSCSASVTGGNDPGPGVHQKSSTHANFVQCGGAESEVLLNVTSSDLEDNIIHNGPIMVRDITQAGSPYATIEPNTIPGTMTSSAQPGVYNFMWGTADGNGNPVVSLILSTSDFKTGQLLYTPGANASTQGLGCSFTDSVTPPEALPVPPTPPAPPAPTAYYLDCVGSVYEVYVNFNQNGIDIPSWTNVSAGLLGERPVTATTSNFAFFGNATGSSYSMDGTNYYQDQATDDSGDQFNFSLTSSNLTNATASVSAATAAGTQSSDSLSCSWLTANIYAGRYGF